MDHSSSVRVTALVPGDVVNMLTWTSNRTEQVVYFAFYLDAQHNIAKQPQLNKMDGLMQFVDSDGVPFIAVQRNACLVHSVTGKRLTFGYIGEVPVAADAPIGVVTGDAEYTVEECKLSKKRRLDAERKRAARALAKQGTAAADEALAA